ncbi:MAG: flippase-like domain-containing protein, partial [Acidobacteria bacterium]|nr:flippase-like domain-containing protein [Acidobacteriota bacterium]
VTVAVLLTAVIFWRSHPSEVVTTALHADLRYIGCAVALVLLDRALMAYRWLVLLRPLAGAARLSLGVVMRIFFVSTFVGTFLPASVGGDAVRAYSLSRHEVPGAAAVASVFMDRMLGVLSVLILATAGLFLVRDLVLNPAVILALALTAAACLVTALVVFSGRAARWGRTVAGVLPWAWLRHVASALIDAIQQYSAAHRELLNVLAGSLGVQVLRVVQAYFLGQALGIHAPLTAYFAFVPLILLVMLLPITVNGIGTSQAAFVWFFAGAGVPSAPAFALSVLFVALGVVGNLPGGFLYATGGLQRRP